MYDRIYKYPEYGEILRLNFLTVAGKKEGRKREERGKKEGRRERKEGRGGKREGNRGEQGGERGAHI